jgi:hypothetical protein
MSTISSQSRKSTTSTLLLGHIKCPAIQPRIEEPVSGRATQGAIAGDQGALEKLMVEDDCRPACDIWTRQSGGWALGGTLERIEVRRFVHACNEAGVLGMVLSWGVARCRSSTCAFPWITLANASPVAVIVLTSDDHAPATFGPS